MLTRRDARMAVENYGYQVLYGGEPISMPYARALRRIKGERVYLFKEPDFDWKEDTFSGTGF